MSTVDVEEEGAVRVDTGDVVIVVSMIDSFEVVESPKMILLFSRAASVDDESGCVLSFSV